MHNFLPTSHCIILNKEKKKQKKTKFRSLCINWITGDKNHLIYIQNSTHNIKAKIYFIIFFVLKQKKTEKIKEGHYFLEIQKGEE